MGLRGADEEITRAIIALRHQGLPWAAVAAEIGRQYGIQATASAVGSHYHYYIGKVSVPAEKPPPPSEPETPRYDDVVVSWNEWLGRRVEEIAAAPAVEEGDTRRIGLICDLHAPYEWRELVARFIADGPYDVIAVVGDLLDYESVSSFVKHRNCTMQEEIQHGTWILETLSGCAKEVWVTTDNHGRRIEKKLASAGLPLDLLALLRWFTPNLDILGLMAQGLPNVKIANTPRPVRDGSTIVTSFLVQLGDAIFGHPDMAHRKPLSTVGAFTDWLREWEYVAELNPFRVIGMAHTHQLGIHYARGGHELQMELGCAVNLAGLQYALEGRRRYRPPVRAYTTLEQGRIDGNWITDFNTVRQTLC